MFFLKWMACASICLLIVPSCVRAQGVEVATNEPHGDDTTLMNSPEPKAVPRAADDPTKDSASSQLKNVGFGVGLALQWNVLNPPIVTDATVDANGIVRVNTRANTSPSLLLEMHYIAKKFKNGDQGFGPFVAVQPGGNNQVISSVGAGILYDWKINTVTAKGSKNVAPNAQKSGKVDDSGNNATRKGFGLGIGYASIPAAKTLGDEFIPNTKAPVGPDGKPIPIRFETRDKGSIMMLLSFTF